MSLVKGRLPAPSFRASLTIRMMSSPPEAKRILFAGMIPTLNIPMLQPLSCVQASSASHRRVACDDVKQRAKGLRSGLPFDASLWQKRCFIREVTRTPFAGVLMLSHSMLQPRSHALAFTTVSRVSCLSSSNQRHPVSFALAFETLS